MTTLDPTLSSFIVLDSHTLYGVTGAGKPTPDGEKPKPKPSGRAGKVAGLGALIGAIYVGGEAPGPEDLPRHIPEPPRPGTIIGAPPNPGWEHPPLLNPTLIGIG
jgi:hypothetical protein